MPFPKFFQKFMFKSDNSPLYPKKPSCDHLNLEIQQWFKAVDQDKTGHLKWEELQAALIIYQGYKFSDLACKLMIEMFNRDRSRTINFNEFKQLFGYITQWWDVFNYYDHDKSGFIDKEQFEQAFQDMDYKFSREFVRVLMRKSDPENHRKITLDRFMMICIQIRRLTEAFREKDKGSKGVITIGFEEFLNLALNCYTS